MHGECGAAAFADARHWHNSAKRIYGSAMIGGQGKSKSARRLKRAQNLGRS
jgi:hypothetical protein